MQSLVGAFLAFHDQDRSFPYRKIKISLETLVEPEVLPCCFLSDWYTTLATLQCKQQPEYNES